MPSETRTIELPFTTRTGCRIRPAPAGSARPPLLVSLHGQGQSGARQERWITPAVPDHFAAAFPDGFHKHEVRRPGRPIRLGYGWYLYTGDQDEFAASLAESEAALWRIVDAALEALGADPQRVYLSGFSQGAYLTHCAAVRAARRVAGWIGQSGRLKAEFLGAELAGVAGKAVLIQHGRQDEALAPTAAEESAAILSRNGADVTLRLYDTGHIIAPEMVVDMRAWLEAREPA